ncbi:MAG: glutamine amidotransferase [Gemmataceae bacterium]|nr:glutamine amidotransferase [Gemmataceae bacterium]
MTVPSPEAGRTQGVRNDLDKTVRVEVDRAIRDVGAEEFDVVHLPGGTVNASLRAVPEGRTFLRAMQDAGKPLAAGCHAP